MGSKGCLHRSAVQPSELLGLIFEPSSASKARQSARLPPVGFVVKLGQGVR